VANEKYEASRTYSSIQYEDLELLLKELKWIGICGTGKCWWKASQPRQGLAICEGLYCF